MKLQNIRRAGGLAFALFLALILTLALTAPGPASAASSAEDEDKLMIYISGSSVATTECYRDIGETVRLVAKWPGDEQGQYTFKWECEVGGIADEDQETVEINVLENTTLVKSEADVTVLRAPDNDVTITVTAVDYYSRAPVETATCKLTIARPVWTITNNPTGNTMQIGEEKGLTVTRLTNVPSGISYKWEQTGGDGEVTFSGSTGTSSNNTFTGNAPTVTAAKAGSVEITVSAVWAHSDCPNSSSHVVATETRNITVAQPALTIKDAGTDVSGLNLKIGEGKTLSAEVTNVASTVTPDWSWTIKDGSDFVTLADVSTPNPKVTGKAATEIGKFATITVTATWNGKVIATKDLTVTVTEPTLRILNGSNNDSDLTGRRLDLKIGGKVTLKAELEDVSETSGVRYAWDSTSEDGGTVSPDSGDKDSITVTGTNAGSVKVTLTVKSLDDDTTIGTATCTLAIDGPELTMTANGNAVGSDKKLPMQIGDEVTLKVDYTNAPVDSSGNSLSPSSYTWTPIPSGSSVVFSEEPTNTDTAKIKASTSGETKIAVKVTWTDSDFGTAEVTYELTADVAGPKLSITAGGKTVDDDENPLELGVDKSVELKAELADGPANAEYTWSVTEEGAEEAGDAITLKPDIGDTTTVTANHTTGKKVTITVTASWGDAATDKTQATCEVTILAPVESIELTSEALKDGKLTLKMYGSVTLTATVLPENALNKEVTWSSDRRDIADVDETGKVTGVAVGTAIITVASVEDPTITATCEVTVEPATITGITIGTSDTIIRANKDPNPWELTAVLSPEGAKMEEGGEIRWSVELKAGKEEGKPSVTGLEGDPLKATVKNVLPGDYTVTATYVKDGAEGPSAAITVTISGITLSETALNLLVGQNRAIAVDGVYGFADNGVGTSDVVWTSSDPAVVSVMHGELTARKLGTAVITASKNGYTMECEVVVGEDKDVIIGPYSATTGNPLVLSNGKLYKVYDDLKRMSQKKTGDRDQNGDWVEGTGSDLDYITNVTVPTSQGTLYYRYISEADPGSAIGSSDRFAETADNTKKGLDLLYFVPKQGFTGTAEITFIGWAENGDSFSGVIRVDVSGADDVISYRTQSGVPVYFLADDFDAFCRSRNGRSMNYVTFTLPPAGQGVLYYNYVAGDGLRVSASTRFSQTGRYTVGDVCFVPNAAFVGSGVTIFFHGVDTADQAFDGSVVVTVTPPSGDSSGTYLSGERGGPVVFQSSQLNLACRAAINDNLNFVTFKLPALEEGTLYYNYRGAGDFESRVNATTRYFYSGVPGINNVAFVPNASATGRIAISYTGYGVSGATFEGTLYISLDEVDTNIYYFAAKNGPAAFDRADFNTVGLHRLGVSVDYVTFDLSQAVQEPNTSLGTLRYDYRSSSNRGSEVRSGTFYVNPKSGQRGLNQLSFLAEGVTGTVKIPYTAYSGTGSSQKSFSGYVVIQVGSFTPADTGVSCVNSGWARLSGSDLSSACRTSMSGSLSYIEITSVPDPAMGHLYLNYYGFGTGTAVNPGDRFYYSGSPNIGDLRFVPRAGFTGEAEITYIGYGSDSLEQASGRVIVTVTSTKISAFNDMGGYAWAIDSVEFLRQSGTVQGYGDGRFNPEGVITRGDFALMLVRAYGLTASGGSSFHDVPAGSYYADAVRVAAALGIVQGYNGYFYPTTPLSRQDAMTMIFNIMKASGQTVSNGLAADFSVFRDDWQIAAYAREAMGSLIQMGIVKGDGSGNLLPLKQLDRAEAAVLMHNIMTL